MFLTPAVRNLLFINAGLLLVPSLLGRLDILNELLGLHSVDSSLFSPFQFFSYMFLHGGFSHLFMNMLGLVFFGPWLEKAWGTQRFLIFYLICGIGAGLLYSVANWVELQGLVSAHEAFMRLPDPDTFAQFNSEVSQDIYRSPDVQAFIEGWAKNPDNAEFRSQATTEVNHLFAQCINGPMVGASGAIYAILIATALLYPDMGMYFFPLPFPIPMKYAVIIFGGLSLFGVLKPSPGDNVAHFAHLGGMLFGWIMVRVYHPRK